MDRGELVPDETVIEVVEERFGEDDPLERRLRARRLPAHAASGRGARRILGRHPLDLVIDLDVPTEIVLDRIAGRRVCMQCGAMYHVNKPPKEDWTCDVCGGQVVQRDDDTEEAICRRLELYESRPCRSSTSTGARLLVESTGSARATRCSRGWSEIDAALRPRIRRDHPQDAASRSR